MVDKQGLRKQIRAWRKGLDANTRAQWSEQAIGHLMASPAWLASETVAAFVSTPVEVDTSPLLDSDKRIVLPVIKAQQALRFRAYMGVLEDGPYKGIQQPPASSPEIPLAAIDLFVVPALAVDETGGRLGQGGGYYDRTLMGAPNTPRFALVFRGQVIDEVPMEPHDLRLHGFFDETGMTTTG